MGIKKYTAYTTSRRNTTGLDFSEIIKKVKVKRSLTRCVNESLGKFFVKHKGGGNKIIGNILAKFIGIGMHVQICRADRAIGNKVENRVSNCLPMPEISVEYQCRMRTVNYHAVGGNKSVWIKKRLGRPWKTGFKIFKVARREFSSGYSHLAAFNNCQIAAQEIRTSPAALIADCYIRADENTEVVIQKRIRHNMLAV